MVIQGGRLLEFETSEVQEIAALMKRYCEQLSTQYKVAGKIP
jgi:hypothetical protein